jgi:hypothetical protein
VATRTHRVLLKLDQEKQLIGNRLFKPTSFFTKTLLSIPHVPYQMKAARLGWIFFCELLMIAARLMESLRYANPWLFFSNALSRLVNIR